MKYYKILQKPNYDDDIITFNDENNVMRYCTYGTEIGEIRLYGNLVDNFFGIYSAKNVSIHNIKNLWNIDTLKYLYENNVNMRIDDDLVLFEACKHYGGDIINFLISIGADVHSCNDRCIWGALYYKNNDAIEILSHYEKE